MSGVPLPETFPLAEIILRTGDARAGLEALQRLLVTSKLDEEPDILPLFRNHPHLCALFSRVYFIDQAWARLAFRCELTIGFFRADLVVADLHRNHYLLVEFEHGHADSIFTTGGRSTPAWSKTFERGYSQIVDWFWWLARNSESGPYPRLFPRAMPTISGLLVIGRDIPEQETELRERLAWRMLKTRVDSHEIYLSTYDELYRALRSNLQAM